MTEQNVESNATVAGTPVPTGASTTSIATSAISPEMQAALESLIDRKLQSSKDKRIAKLQEELASVVQRLDERQLEALEARLSPKPSGSGSELPKSAQSTPGTGLTAQPVMDDGLLKKIGLDPSDARVADALSDLTDGRKVLEKLAQLLTKPTPTQSQQLPSGGTSYVESREEVTNQLWQAMREPLKNAKLIEELNKKLTSMSG